MNKLKQDVDSLIKQRKEKQKKEDFNRMIVAFDEVLKKGIKINEEITVSNFSELFEHLKFNFPESFKIENPEDIARYITIPDAKDFPKSFAISNAHDIAKYIKFPENKFPEEFKISNLSEIGKIEFPESLSKLSLNKTEQGLKDIFDRIGIFAKEFKNTYFVTNKKPSEAIPVRIVDEDGFVNKKQDFKFSKEGALIVEPTRVGQGGGGADTSLLATEETLQAVLASSGSSYNFVQSEEGATYEYYGFASSTGWRIKRMTVATGIWKVAEGTGDYDTAWADRASKTYIYA
jgi:hypothetical protein